VEKRQNSVVIVEDEPAAAELFAEMMRVSGFKVFHTSSSTKAVDLIANELPDLVLLDVMMPGVSGLEVVRFIRREPHLAHIPVIIVSAKTTKEDIQEGLEAGANIYLTKPVSFGDLEGAIRQVLPEDDMDSKVDAPA
jgi:DNA-binding response OmpR family regulator